MLALAGAAYHVFGSTKASRTRNMPGVRADRRQPTMMIALYHGRELRYLVVC